MTFLTVWLTDAHESLTRGSTPRKKVISGPIVVRFLCVCFHWQNDLSETVKTNAKSHIRCGSTHGERLTRYSKTISTMYEIFTQWKYDATHKPLLFGVAPTTQLRKRHTVNDFFLKIFQNWNDQLEKWFLNFSKTVFYPQIFFKLRRHSGSAPISAEWIFDAMELKCMIYRIPLVNIVDLVFSFKFWRIFVH